MQRDTLHQRVFDEVGFRIVAGRLGTGEVINLAAIESEFGVSRTVAREAMRLLEASGLIEVRRRVGLIVAPRERWRLLERNFVAWMLRSDNGEELARELFFIWCSLGPEAARRSALNAIPEERARLKRLATNIREMAEAGVTADDQDFLAATREFSSLIYSSGRSLLVSEIGLQAVPVVHSPQFIGRLLTSVSTWAQAIDEVADAIWVSDGDGAAEAARGLVAGLEKLLGVRCGGSPD